MHSVECDSGKDRVGRTYHFQAMDMYRRLGYALKQPRPVGCETSENIQQEGRALTRIIWAIFCHDGLVLTAPSSPIHVTSANFQYGMSAFLYGFELSVKIPLVEQYFLVVDIIRTELDIWDGEWTPYPIFKPLQPSLLTPVLQAQCILGQIFYEVTLSDYSSGWDKSQSEVWAKVADQLPQPLLWKEGLDPRLLANNDSVAYVYHLQPVFRNLRSLVWSLSPLDR